MEISEEEQVIGNLSVSLPKLSPTQLIEISNRLISAQEKFSEVSSHDIVHWIAEVSAHWSDPNDPIRREAEVMLPQACGLSKEMVRVVLDDLFRALTEPALHQLLEAELGDARRLDAFCLNKNGTGRTRAFGPRLMTQILPGNVLGVSVVSLVLGLLVKSANLMRVSPEEVVLTTLFAQSLQQHWPEGAETLAVLTWDKTHVELSKAAFQKADLVMVYGSDETIAAIREMIPPAKKTIFHGHKLSLGVIARESVCVDLAQKAAMDVALYDQRGCLSPQVYYVESGGEMSPLDFARQVAEALDVLSWKLPKGAYRTDEASRIQQLRGTLPLKGGVVFQSSQGVGWTVLYDLKPEFRPSPLSRTLWIKPVDDLARIAPLIEPVRQVIQAIGLAAPKERAAALVEGLSKVGGCRFCSIGEMQRPSLSGYHDGVPRLLPLLRFVEWENR